MEQVLRLHAWPPAMIDYFAKQVSPHPKQRFILCDDSGSMELIGGSGQLTRWQEMIDSVKFHAEVATHSNIPMTVKFLRGFEWMELGKGNFDGYGNFLRKCETTRACGDTPRIQNLKQLLLIVQKLQHDQTITGATEPTPSHVLLYSDGEASDGSNEDVVKTLKSFSHLNVSFTVCLCTNEEKVVAYWNKIERDVELPLDILADWPMEADEVYEHNPWLCYGKPLHQLRQCGLGETFLDRLDEHPLYPEQRSALQSLLMDPSSPMTFCPRSKTIRPWLEVVTCPQAEVEEEEEDKPTPRNTLRDLFLLFFQMFVFYEVMKWFHIW